MSTRRICYVLLLTVCVTAASGKEPSAPLAPVLGQYIQARLAEFDLIPAERKQQLATIAQYARRQRAANQPARLLFICTHNSRRSHLAQIWAHAAADYYGIRQVETYSGGTEVTAFNPRAIAALTRAGFAIAPMETASATNPNPHYHVRSSPSASPIECFSKIYTAAPNPQSDFMAVMTCSEADQNCPLVSGAARRLGLPYDDPKAFDGTSEEAARYDERCRQIAREMLYAFSTIEP